MLSNWGNVTVNIPVELYNQLLNAYYFQKACEMADVKSWGNYETACRIQAKLALEDINAEVKE